MFFEFVFFLVKNGVFVMELKFHCRYRLLASLGDEVGVFDELVADLRRLIEILTRFGKIDDIVFMVAYCCSLQYLFTNYIIIFCGKMELAKSGLRFVYHHHITMTSSLNHHNPHSTLQQTPTTAT